MTPTSSSLPKGVRYCRMSLCCMPSVSGKREKDTERMSLPPLLAWVPLLAFIEDGHIDCNGLLPEAQERKSYFRYSTFLCTWAVPSIMIFWILFVLMLSGIQLVTLSSPYFISPRASMTTGIALVFISKILLISISRPLYLDTYSISDGIVISMSMHLIFLSCS